MRGRAAADAARPLPQIWLLHGQRVVDELRLFAVVPLEHAGRRRCRFDATGISRTARLDLRCDDAVFQTAVDEGPSPHVARLFLAPTRHRRSCSATVRGSATCAGTDRAAPA